MELSDFQRGQEFFISDKKWRCTDVGSRVVVAVCLSTHEDDPSWYNGPPYAVEEVTFDENEIPACVKNREDL